MLESDQKGVVVAVTCGTGVVMFLDLAMYLLRMIVYKVGRTKKKNYLLFGNETFDRLTDKSFKLVLFSAFHDSSHVLGEKLFRALHDLSVKYGYNNFEYHLRVADKGQQRWDEDTFKRLVPLTAQKIILVGPCEAETSIYTMLKNIGIQDRQFHRV
jgi:hypothetical protein